MKISASKAYCIKTLEPFLKKKHIYFKIRSFAQIKSINSFWCVFLQLQRKIVFFYCEGNVN